MSSSSDEVASEILPFIRIYKDGRVERLLGTEIVAATPHNPETGVSSKDVIILPETGVSARLFLPNITAHSSSSGEKQAQITCGGADVPKERSLFPLCTYPGCPEASKGPHMIHIPRKLPLLIYIHGGGFCTETPFSPTYDRYVSSLVAEANVVAVSVHYRRAPDHPLPIAYDDSWAALQWVASHSKGKGPESWLNEYADLSRVYMVGDSAGATIIHNMALRAAETPLEGVGFAGLGLVCPFFLREEVSDEEKEFFADKLWMVMCPSTTGFNDPLINPAACKNLKGLACKRVLVCVAEKDKLIGGGLFYHKTLGMSGWEGELELMESKGEEHVYHLSNPTNINAVSMKARLVSFLNKND